MGTAESNRACASEKLNPVALTRIENTRIFSEGNIMKTPTGK
jgi:hypothetical protein